MGGSSKRSSGRKKGDEDKSRGKKREHNDEEKEERAEENPNSKRTKKLEYSNRLLISDLVIEMKRIPEIPLVNEEAFVWTLVNFASAASKDEFKTLETDEQGAAGWKKLYFCYKARLVKALDNNIIQELTYRDDLLKDHNVLTEQILKKNRDYVRYKVNSARTLFVNRVGKPQIECIFANFMASVLVKVLDSRGFKGSPVTKKRRLALLGAKICQRYELFKEHDKRWKRRLSLPTEQLSLCPLAYDESDESRWFEAEGEFQTPEGSDVEDEVDLGIEQRGGLVTAYGATIAITTAEKISKAEGELEELENEVLRKEAGLDEARQKVVRKKAELDMLRQQQKDEELNGKIVNKTRTICQNDPVQIEDMFKATAVLQNAAVKANANSLMDLIKQYIPSELLQNGAEVNNPGPSRRTALAKVNFTAKQVGKAIKTAQMTSNIASHVAPFKKQVDDDLPSEPETHSGNTTPDRNDDDSDEEGISPDEDEQREHFERTQDDYDQLNQNPQDGRGVGVSEDGDRSDIDESQNGDAAANNDGETIERESETEDARELANAIHNIPK